MNQANRPDMTPLVTASETVGKLLQAGDLVIYESTVYPGATEEVCVPVLEEFIGLKFTVDFFCGYSPERINPSSKKHRLPTIKKVTSDSTPDVAEAVDRVALYLIPLQLFVLSRLPIVLGLKNGKNTPWVCVLLAYSATAHFVRLVFPGTAFALLQYQFYPWAWSWQ